MARTPDQWTGSMQLGRRAEIARRRRRLLTVLVLAASILTCVALAAIAGWSATSAQLRRLDWWVLPVILGTHVTAYAGYLVAHHQVVNRSGDTPVGWRRGAHIGLIGFGAWLIGGGFDVDRRALERVGFSSWDASASVIALGALELALLTPAAAVCAALLVGAPGISASVTVPWVIGVPVGFLLAIRVMLIGSRARRRPGTRRPRRIVIRLDAGLRETLALLRHPRRGPTAVGGIALYWAADMTALWLGLRFAGVTIGLARLIVGYATGYLLTRRTLPFAGVVITEALLAISLVWVGVPLAAAALGVLAYRLSDLALTLVAALASSSVVGRTLTFLDPRGGVDAD